MWPRVSVTRGNRWEEIINQEPIVSGNGMCVRAAIEGKLIYKSKSGA